MQKIATEFRSGFVVADLKQKNILACNTCSNSLILIPLKQAKHIACFPTIKNHLLWRDRKGRPAFFFSVTNGKISKRPAARAINHMCDEKLSDEKLSNLSLPIDIIEKYFQSIQNPDFSSLTLGNVNNIIQSLDNIRIDLIHKLEFATNNKELHETSLTLHNLLCIRRTYKNVLLKFNKSGLGTCYVPRSDKVFAHYIGRQKEKIL
jgi:hypothetical protein